MCGEHLDNASRPYCPGPVARPSGFDSEVGWPEKSYSWDLMDRRDLLREYNCIIIIAHGDEMIEHDNVDEKAEVAG